MKILRNDSNEKYWCDRALKDVTNVNRRDLQRSLIEESRRSSRISSQRIIVDSNIVSTKIKNLAIELLNNNVYNKLDDDKKNTVSNGFNSVLDLSNERTGPNTRKSLFSRSEWKHLKEKYDLEEARQKNDKEVIQH